MANTSNLNLVVTDDSSELFESWRNNLNGTTDSNMTKIDEFAGKFAGGNANQYYKKKSSTKFDGVWETPDSTPTTGSNKLITSGAVKTAIDNVDNKINRRVTITTDGSVEQALSPDVFYDFTGALTSLSISLGASLEGRENEYKGQFLSGASAPLVSFPNTVVWVGGFGSIEANKKYQFSVLNNIGVIVGL